MPVVLISILLKFLLVYIVSFSDKLELMLTFKSNFFVCLLDYFLADQITKMFFCCIYLDQIVM